MSSRRDWRQYAWTDFRCRVIKLHEQTYDKWSVAETKSAHSLFRLWRFVCTEIEASRWQTTRVQEGLPTLQIIIIRVI